MFQIRELVFEKDKRLSFFHFYLLYIVLLAFIFIFIIPPFQKPDEIIHFQRTVSVAHGQLFCNENQNLLIPAGIAELPSQLSVNDIPFKYNNKFNVFLLRRLDFNISYRQLTKLESPLLCSSFFIGYLPNSLGYLLSKPFHNSVINFYSSRLSGFLFFLICLLVSYKTTPKKYRNFLLLFNSLPMVIHQATAVSYDVLHLSLVNLIYAYVVKYGYQKNLLKMKTLLTLSLLLSMFVLVKPSYYPFLLAIFLILKKRDFNARKKFYIFYFILFFALNLYLNAQTLFVSQRLFPFDRIQFANPSYQKIIVFKDPVYFLKIFINTLSEMGEFYVSSAIGILGWLDYRLKYYIYYFYIGMLFLVLSQYKKRETSASFLMIFSLILSLSVVLIFVSLYLYWTPVGKEVISGVQGRNLLPLIPFFFLFIAEIKNLISHNIKGPIFYFSLVVLLLMSITSTIFYRYYDYSVLIKNSEEFNSICAEENLNNLQKISIKNSKDFNVSANVGKKISGFHFCFLKLDPNQSVPYKWLVKDKDCVQTLAYGYIDAEKTAQSGMYTQIFMPKGKKIKIKQDEICFQFQSLVKNSEKENIYILSENGKPLINALYIN